MKQHSYMKGESLRDKDAALEINRIIAEINKVKGDMSYILYIGQRQLKALHRISRFDSKAFKDMQFLDYRVIVLEDASYIHLARKGLVVMPDSGVMEIE